MDTIYGLWYKNGLYDWLLVRLYLFQKLLKNDCYRFKQTIST